jgi:hypothetical protein
LIKKEKIEKMQISKKLYTTLIIAILTLSTIMAVMPMASAEVLTPPYCVTKGGTTAVTGGAVGTQVDIVGNTTSGAASPFSTVKVYWDALSGAVLGTGSADVNGAYRITVKIPPAVFGTHYLVVNDGETESEGAQFDVTPTISASVTRALPGDSVTVTGHGYAANDAITLTLNSTTLTTPYSTTITTSPTTNATGSFSVAFVVPTIATANYDVYSLNGTDEASNMASTTINIDYYITLTPATGPTGITTTISGRIKANVAYAITFNAAQIATGTTSADGSYSYAYTIPGVLSPAGYPVVITWETTNTRTATFTVTTAPTISLGASNGVSGTVVTITGSGFSGKADVTLYFGATVVNSTTMDANFGPTTTGGALPAGLTFVVPALAPGVYSVSVVDEYGATSAAGVFFTIDATPVTTIAIRSTTYYPMDIFSFNIYTTEPSLGTITVTVYDPSNRIWWMTADWTLTSMGAYNSVIFQNQGADLYNQMRMMLPADAPLGTWNWTITYTPTSTATLTTATGLFAVVERPTMQTVLDQLDALEATITDIVTDSEGDLTALINTKAGPITTKLDAVGPKLQAIEDTAVIIATMLGEVQVDLAALDLTAMGVDITAIKGDVATIKSNIGTVTTNVATLDAKVVALSGDVATVSTTLGTLQGTVTAIDGKVATVSTNVGTIKADVSDIKAKPDVDMTPVWIAVVLSLIAAIAAIFAVVTIRQKIAG